MRVSSMSQMDLDIDIAPTKPSDVYIDAQAVLEGAGAERMPKLSRWMGTRYAMVWYAEDSSTVKLRKVRAEFNVADIVTKCLVGAAFVTRIPGQLHHPVHGEVTTESTAAAESRRDPTNPKHQRRTLRDILIPVTQSSRVRGT